MAGTLQHFGPDQIVITTEQAGRILKFFFPDQPVPLATPEDVAFAQALLVEAINASTEMGYVQVLFDKAFMKVPADFGFIKSIAKALCKKALKNWFRHATGEDLRDPKIYESVRRQLAVNFRSVWALRLQTEELTY